MTWNIETAKFFFFVGWEEYNGKTCSDCHLVDETGNFSSIACPNFVIHFKQKYK